MKDRTSKLESLLEEEEIIAIVNSMSRARGGFTDPEFSKVLWWAEKIRLRQALLQGVLEGILVVHWDEEKQDVRLWAAEHAPGPSAQEKGIDREQ